MKILLVLVLLVFDTSARRIRLHSLPNPEDFNPPISEETVNVTSTINNSEIIRDSRETKIFPRIEDWSQGEDDNVTSVDINDPNFTRIFPRLEVYESQEEEIQENSLNSLLTRILISEDEDEIQAIVQVLPPESLAKLVVFSNALSYLHKIEDLFKQFNANVDLEEDLTFQQRALVGFKLVQIHTLIDEAVEKAIPRDGENVPFHLPLSIY